MMMNSSLTLMNGSCCRFWKKKQVSKRNFETGERAFHRDSALSTAYIETRRVTSAYVLISYFCKRLHTLFNIQWEPN